jgi:hypothetical protein
MSFFKIILHMPIDGKITFPYNPLNQMKLLYFLVILLWKPTERVFKPLFMVFKKMWLRPSTAVIR